MIDTDAIRYLWAVERVTLNPERVKIAMGYTGSWPEYLKFSRDLRTYVNMSKDQDIILYTDKNMRRLLSVDGAEIVVPSKDCLHIIETSASLDIDQFFNSMFECILMRKLTNSDFSLLLETKKICDKHLIEAKLGEHSKMVDELTQQLHEMEA